MLSPSTVSRFLTAGALCAFVDALWAMALTALNGRPPLGVWATVASVAFGPEMLQRSGVATLVGLSMHVGVAFAWSALFLLVDARVSSVRRLVSSTRGLLVVASLYGPTIWVVMSTVVIPLMTGRPPRITGQWFVQLAGHAAFVGLPIVWGARRTPLR